MLDIFGAMEIVALFGLILFLGLWLLGVKDVILRVITNFRLVIYFPIVVIIEFRVVISIMISFVREVVIIWVFIIAKVLLLRGLVLIQQILSIP